MKREQFCGYSRDDGNFRIPYLSVAEMKSLVLCSISSKHELTTTVGMGCGNFMTN